MTNEFDHGELVKWIIRSDRRLIAIRSFRLVQFMGASAISKRTGRSIQNISTGLKELERRGIVEQLEPGRRTWKKYRLTPVGRRVLDSIERTLSAGMFERVADEFSFKYVREAYRLLVADPILVTRQMRLHEVVDRVLADPRTRTAYVVDDKRKLLGTIGLKQMLTAVEGSLMIVDKGRAQRRSKRPVLPFSVEEYMVRAVSVRPDDRIMSALQKMIRYGQEDLAVVDEDGFIIGELNGFEILLLGSETMKRQAWS